MVFKRREIGETVPTTTLISTGTKKPCNNCYLFPWFGLWWKRLVKLFSREKKTPLFPPQIIYMVFKLIENKDKDKDKDSSIKKAQKRTAPDAFLVPVEIRVVVGSGGIL